MHAFFAIKIPQETLELVGEETTKIKDVVEHSVKWVNPTRMHLTLKFLGDFSPHHINAINLTLLQLFSSEKPFEICINGFGVFPGFNNPRVLWFGIQAKPQLSKAAKLIENTCANFGYEKEKRPFSPHLTIGRMKKGISQEERNLIGSALRGYTSQLALRFSVMQIYLMKSELTPKGPIYSEIFSIAL